MKIGGLQKTTLIDFPGRIAATVFVVGCNFSCLWCYSSEIVLPEKIKDHPVLPEKEFFKFLKERRGLLEGVVICGGEPTLYKDLPSFIKKIKRMGYFVKLDTNGSNPKMLGDLIKKKLIDYVAMDVKVPKGRYKEIFGEKVKVEDIEKSIKILNNGKIDFEFRTTIVPTIHQKGDILEMARWISPAKKYFLQNFLAEKTIDPAFIQIKPYSQEWLLDVQKTIAPFFEICQIR